MSPVSSGRVVPPCVLTTRKPGGERHRPVTRLNKWCGSEKPAAKPKKEKAPKKEEEPSKDGLITFDQVMNVKLKTAVVLEAEKIEGADKLLKLQIDLGEEKRQLVAGIALH